MLTAGLSFQEAFYYGGQVLLALHDLHRRGIIHRDVKPENLVVGCDGHPVLIDFGIAARLDDTTANYPVWTTLRQRGTDHFPMLWSSTDNPCIGSKRCGTEGYASPEVYADPARYSYAVDLWSLGATIHVWRTGHVSA
ncbi:kinase-like domain-containing protein [Mycena crocata]|nr:kinase-like domain-containing protein [Mycena crocata]KAJ7143430.1 kinase-like domain-containing protein [Mycena crocata]